MPLYQLIVLGIVQGLTEFLPVSSTAHLYLTSWLLGWPDQGLTFDIALHVGTLAAVLIYFFQDWVQILAQGFGLRAGKDPELKRNPMLLWLLAGASIPVGVVGLLFNKQAETTWRTPWVMGIMLIVIGVLMAVSERVGRRIKDMALVSGEDAAAIGVAQALAVIPGASRSGVTIAAGLFRNLDRETAARFSFLLSTPAIAGAALHGLHQLSKSGGIPVAMKVPFLLGISVSAVVGFLTIAFFLDFLRSRTLNFFCYYRIIFGIIVIALASFR
ncbi:MAG: undecaprenyl-diphosphatase UppP [Bryobacteraceae bacterium]